MKSYNKANELNIKEYSVIKNMLYCLKCTVNHYPLLLLFCACAVLVNVMLPVLATYLPKVVIDKITSGDNLKNLIIVVLAFTLSIAVLSGFKRFIEKYIYGQKFRMNTFYTRKVANKGMTTDYCNQEKEQFRKLQSESFNSCNGHYSPLAQIYDVNISLFSNALGFIVYFGILTKLNSFIVLFLIVIHVFWMESLFDTGTREGFAYIRTELHCRPDFWQTASKR